MALSKLDKRIIKAATIKLQVNHQAEYRELLNDYAVKLGLEVKDG